MTTYFVRVSEREYQIDIAGDQIKVDGRIMQARLTPINQNGHFLLQTDSTQREVHIRENEKDVFLATIASRYFKIQIERNLHKRPTSLPAVQGELKAPMPAKVIDVPVQQGDRVRAGQTVILLESMKMQLEIKAPFSGLVDGISVQAGGQVEKGSRLASIIPAVG